jgi:hypothetical protein
MIEGWEDVKFPQVVGDDADGEAAEALCIIHLKPGDDLPLHCAGGLWRMTTRS